MADAQPSGHDMPEKYRPVFGPQEAIMIGGVAVHPWSIAARMADFQFEITGTVEVLDDWKI